MRGGTSIKGTNNDIFNIPTKVYDVEKKQLLGTFESRTKAADFLGVSTVTVSKAFKYKHRIHKNKLGITACIR